MLKKHKHRYDDYKIRWCKPRIDDNDMDAYGIKFSVCATCYKDKYEKVIGINYYGGGKNYKIKTI